MLGQPRLLATTSSCSLPFVRQSAQPSRRKPAQDFNRATKPNSRSTLYQQMQVKQKGLQRSAATAPPLAPLFFEAPQYPVGNSVEAVVSGDFNSDGKVDLVIADYCMDEDAR